MPAIILYFSRTGENYVSGSIQNLTKGNTEIAAELIQQLTGAELFQIEPSSPYSFHYSECIEQAKNDQKRDARPQLVSYPESLEQYDTIYLGYPNYWGTMPMPVFTLLEKFDFTGKTIKPFCTHEGSGMGHSEEDIRKLCRNTDVRHGLAITGARVRQAMPEIKKWLEK